MVRILFVCLGNICRSPTAVGVFRAGVARAGLSDRVLADGAGTHAFHIGEPPDPRAVTHARRRGVDLSSLRARQVEPADFATYDHVLALDRENFANLEAGCPPGLRGRLGLLLDHAPELGLQEVPDPYYGGPDGFDRVLDLCEAGARGLLVRLRELHDLR